MGGDQLLKRIGELVHEKRLEGISDLRNESDKKGTRLAIELVGRTSEQVWYVDLSPVDDPTLVAPTCAVVTKADGSRAVVAESSDLRALRGRPPDRGKPAYSAFDELVAKLARLGWTASGRGDEWFAVAFVRTPPTAAGLQQRRLDRET